MGKIQKQPEIQPGCVACGCCAKACPIAAVHIDRGIVARVDVARCVGCGRCAQACPASVILMKEQEVMA